MPTSRITALGEERHQLQVQGAALIDAAQAAGRALTDEEQAGFTTIETRLSAIADEIALEERMRAFPRPNAGARISDGEIVPAAFARPAVEEKPWGYDLGVRMIPNPDGTASFGGRPHAADVALGCQLQAIASAALPGGQVDPRLYRAAASGGNTSVPSDGGFMVQTDLSMMLFDRAIDTAVLAPRCTQIEIGANSDGIEMPYVDEVSRATGSRWGGVRVYRRAEADTVTASKPTLDLFELRLADIMGLAYVTDRLLQDAAALGQLYRIAFTSEFAFKLDDEIIRGTGVGECQGILSTPSLVSVAKETGQAADTIVHANLSKMHARMLPRFRGGAVWLMNIAAEPQLEKLTVDVGTAGALVYLPPSGIRETVTASLYGKPVLTIEQASALGDQGDVIFANLSEYLLIRKGGIGFAESMHVRFIHGENTFRWMQRVNGKAPAKSAITPYKGADTLSAFVTLDAR